MPARLGKGTQTMPRLVLMTQRHPYQADTAPWLMVWQTEQGLYFSPATLLGTCLLVQAMACTARHGIQ